MQSFDFMNNNKIDYEAIRLSKLQALSKEKLIIDLLNKYHINIEDINNLSLLEEYLNNEKICQNCKSLAMCPFSNKGQKLSLEYDHQFYPVKEYCHHYNDYHKKLSFTKNIIYNDIPNALINIDLDNISINKNNPDMVNLYVYYNKIKDGSINKGIYIYGKFGTGKTYMSIAFINSMAKLNKRCAFVKVNDFINKMRKMIINEPYEYEYTIDDIKKVEYLVLDDIGTESISAFIRDDLLFNILDYRMEHKLITIFTSNNTMSTLRESFIYDKNLNKDTLKADRLMERIRVLSNEFHLSGENLRK